MAPARAGGAAGRRLISFGMSFRGGASAPPFCCLGPGDRVGVTCKNTHQGYITLIRIVTFVTSTNDIPALLLLVCLILLQKIARYIKKCFCSSFYDNNRLHRQCLERPCGSLTEHFFMSRPSASGEVRELQAGLCAALGDPNRLHLLYALASRPDTVTDLAAAAGLSQATASRHLRILRDHGLVRAKRQGLSVEYRLTDERIIQVLDLLLLVLRQTHARQAGWLTQPLHTPKAAEAVS